MPFDGLILASVCAELNAKLPGMRVEKIYQPDKNEITLRLGGYGNRQQLVISSHPLNHRVHLTTARRENPTQPPLFCMVLRKHLEGWQVKGFRQPELERILNIEFEGRDELGRLAQKLLICEFMGKHSNILLVDPVDNTIIDGIKRYTHNVSRHREVLPGKQYISPPAQGKANPFFIDEDGFRELIINAPLEKRVYKVIQASLQGLSMIMSKEIVYRAGLPEDLVVNYCGEHEIRVLWQALQAVTQPATRNEYNVTALYDSGGNPVEFAAFDLTHLTYPDRRHGEPSRVLDEFFTARRELERLAAEKQSLLTWLNKRIKQVDKKRELQIQNLDQARQAETFRLYGELLMANLHCLQKGRKEIELDNFYSTTADPVTIPLSPELSPVENARAYFKKYNKAKHTREEAQKQISISTREINYLQSVLLAVDQSSSLAELEEVKQELMQQGYLRRDKKVHKKEDKKSIAPLTYTSSDGFTILVGRNNRQNDFLTFKRAEPGDIWLHTKDIPGSHVIIKTGNQDVPGQTLYEAAVLAAYFSRARNSQNVPVDYTLRKHVRKPRGARPGYVIYDNQRTLTVNPDEKLVNSLARSHKD